MNFNKIINNILYLIQIKKNSNFNKIFVNINF